MGKKCLNFIIKSVEKNFNITYSKKEGKKSLSAIVGAREGAF